MNNQELPWKKFSEEMPTAKGDYIVWCAENGFSMKTHHNASYASKQYGYTHWLLIALCREEYKNMIEYEMEKDSENEKNY